MGYDPIEARRADLQRQIADAQRALDTLSAVPQEDTYADGTIIRAEISQRLGVSKTYVFLKIVNGPTHANGYNPSTRWYHTGFISHSHSTDRGNKPYFNSWNEFQSWLIERGRVVESWDVVEPRCELNHVTRRSHEDVRADILDVLRFEYSNTEASETKHLRVIQKILMIEGVYPQ